ncbi:8-oxoguanine deaminase [bacterium]|nr:8-oxoguanine deaminase [candidate division CSSED10-310 bacterium]
MPRTCVIRNLTAVFTGYDTLLHPPFIDIAITGNRISAVGPDLNGSFDTIINGTGCVAIPGLVNTHHHFFQVLTRVIPRMQNAPLFPWLVNHYRIWEGLTQEAVYWSSLAAMGELLVTGCTTTADHHYLFPRNTAGDLLDIQFRAANDLGIRFLATRGSMSVGQSKGGLPPDQVVQDEDDILADCHRVIDRFHDPSPDSMQRIALAPCSPFSVSETLMRRTAQLARTTGVSLHTHLAETRDEEAYCLSTFGCRPVDLMKRLDWLGPDVWFAHCVHLNEAEIALFGKTGTGTAHCPSSNMRLGSGIAPVRELLDAGAPMGLAVDGSASNDSSDMLGEVRQALLLQRVSKGADAMTVNEALTIGSRGGAGILGFDQTGVIAPGNLADIAVFNLNSLDFVGVHDPIGGLVLCGDCHRAHHVVVNGRHIVKNGHLITISEQDIIDQTRTIASRLVTSASQRTGIAFMTPPRDSADQIPRYRTP